MSDLIERLNGLCERHCGVTPGKWHTEAVFGDVATEVCSSTAGSGNPNVIATTFGEERDDPISTAIALANTAAITDIPAMLAAIREAAAELSRLTADNAALRVDAAFTSRAKALFTSFVYLTNGATGVVEQAIGAASLRFLHDLDVAHTLPALDSARAKESGDG